MNNLLLFTVITIQTMCASCRDRARFSATQLPTASSCKERAHYADYVSYIHTYIHMHLQRQSRQFERAHAAPRSHLPCIFFHARFPCFPLHTAPRIFSANQRSSKNSDAHAASEAGSRDPLCGAARACGSLWVSFEAHLAVGSVGWFAWRAGGLGDGRSGDGWGLGFLGAVVCRVMDLSLFACCSFSGWKERGGSCLCGSSSCIHAICPFLRSFDAHSYRYCMQLFTNMIS